MRYTGIALAAVLLLAGCLSQPRLDFGAFESLKKARIEGLEPAVDFYNITPPTDFTGAAKTQSIYWNINESGMEAVTIWMFEFPGSQEAEKAVDDAFARLQTQKGFPTMITKYGRKEASGIGVKTVSLLGRLDIYMFSVHNIAFWIQQTETRPEYADELALEAIRLGAG